MDDPVAGYRRIEVLRHDGADCACGTGAPGAACDLAVRHHRAFWDASYHREDTFRKAESFFHRVGALSVVLRTPPWRRVTDRVPTERLQGSPLLPIQLMRVHWR